IERLLIASRAIWFYLSKIFWPSNLTFIYPQWRIDPTNPILYFWFILTAACAGLISYLRRFFGRGLEVAALFFVITLGPLLGVIMLYTFRFTFVADHYQYLACIGPIALASAGLVTLADVSKNSRTLIFSVALCVVALLATLTWRQAAMYGNIETFWPTTLSRNPSCWMAHNNLS